MQELPKILFVNATKSDYLQDWTYAGLVALLGKKRVYDYPFNYRYHLPMKEYPKNGGYCPGGMHQRLLNKMGDFDLVILASSHPECFQAYLKIQDRLPKNLPIVFIDGGDRAEIAGDLQRYNQSNLLSDSQKYRNFDLIFKREYLKNKDYPKNVFPYPFCINTQQIPKDLPSDKKYDVSFWAVESHPIRSQALEILEPLYDCKKNGTKKKTGF